LTTAVDRVKGAIEHQREIQNNLDQAKVDLHTVQNENAQLELQKQHKINILRDAAELVRVHSGQQQQQIDQIRQAADQQMVLANTAKDYAAQHLLDAQAIRNQAAIREAAAPVLKNLAVIDQQMADQACFAAQQLAAQAVIDQAAADQAANANVLAQNNIQQHIIQAVKVQTQQL